MPTRLKHDVRYTISILLLILTVAATGTGMIADRWDLNDFVPHKLAGYAMALLALVHTVFEFPRVWAYLRGRLRRRQTDRVGGVPAAVPVRTVSAGPSPARRTESPERQSLWSRRGLLGLLVGGAGGFLVGWLAPGPGSGSPEADLGLRYHRWGRPGSLDSAGPVNWGERPEPFKVYPNRERIRLLAPEDADGEVDELPTFAAIARRRSIRSYGAALSRSQLSRLLFAAAGITEERTGFRAAPSAGALYPIETYVMVHDVEGLAQGLYHYAPQDHALVQLDAGDLRLQSVTLGLMQGFLGEAGAVVVLTALFQRLRWRYRRRSYRYALLEAGHIGQNLYLGATAMGLGVCAVAAFMDDGLNALLGVDGQEEAALYMLAVGTVPN
jgi:SagB-type dehydrogenase family enzyme